MVGLVVGMTRFIWEFSYTVPSCASGQPDPRPDILSKVHYLHFGCILFVVSFMVTIVVSLSTEPIDTKHLYRLTFWTIMNTQLREEPRKSSNTKVSNVNWGEDNCAFNRDDIEACEMKTTWAHSKDQNEEIPLWKRVVFFICGIKHNPNSQDLHGVPIQQVEQRVQEVSTWKNWCNINAILLAIFGSFVWGFYA
ncbi:sodium/glucose cotransporter 4-like [Tachypleus tridentatus]|uniref:sodium/glucose cotransporter 4-like n=1 Tax=Tachypleus tridentatus TaxID=6853 RepID=UPI003FD34F87